MKRFRNILIVCEDVENAKAVLARGLWLARANGARVTLMDVFDSEPGGLVRRYAALTRERAKEIEAQILGFYRARLGEFAVPFREADLEVEIVVGQGTPFLEIIRRVQSENHDLVLKGALPRQGLRLFASNDMHLMRKCPCPVWILREGQPQAARRILASVDPATEDETRMSLNRTVMELATSLAERDGADVHVVHAWRLPEEGALRSGRFKIPDQEVASILDAEEAGHRRALDSLLAAFPEASGRGTSALLNGTPGEAIPAYAAAHEIDTIVMGTIGRTGVRGFFIGNTAETILATVECSVLAVKPPGFVSPVGAAATGD